MSLVGKGAAVGGAVLHAEEPPALAQAMGSWHWRGRGGGGPARVTGRRIQPGGRGGVGIARTGCCVIGPGTAHAGAGRSAGCPGPCECGPKLPGTASPRRASRCCRREGSAAGAGAGAGCASGSISAAGPPDAFAGASELRGAVHERSSVCWFHQYVRRDDLSTTETHGLWSASGWWPSGALHDTAPVEESHQ
eukprot:scaffold133482_cov23-Tisochrysis_lutea.AAC.1